MKRITVPVLIFALCLTGAGWFIGGIPGAIAGLVVAIGFASLLGFVFE